MEWPVNSHSMVLQPAVFLIPSNMHLEIKYNRIEARRNCMLKVNICDTDTKRVLPCKLGKMCLNRMLG
jgi:hypothetical protein